MKITVDLAEVDILVAEADKIFLKPEAEQGLVKLLQLQERIEQSIKQAKQILEAEGLKVNKDFKSIEGDQIKVSYRYFGSKYYIQEDKLQDVPEEFYTKVITTKYSVDAKVVEKWAENNKGLPVGIVENTRLKTINFKLKDAKEV